MSDRLQANLAGRLRRAPRAFTTRRVPSERLASLIDREVAPRPGDLVLARVDSIGHHARLELPNGRRQQLFVGDEILVAFGNRYAPQQFEAIVPGSLEPCHLVPGGGVAGKALSWHRRISRGPTAITPIGLVGDATGQVVNLAEHALSPVWSVEGERPMTIAVTGTSMDSGKTTTAAHLAHGFARAGVPTGFAKITGTGSGGDLWYLADAGASPVFDFTDAGFASTYRVPQAELECVFTTLLHHLREASVQVAILEIADGLFQTETSGLLRCALFPTLVDGLIFAASDAMGASGGVAWLQRHHLRALAISGIVTTSPLGVRETLAATRIPVMSRAELSDPISVRKLVEQSRG